MRRCVLAVWVALLAGTAAAQESQQRFVPSPQPDQNGTVVEERVRNLREYLDVRIDSLDRAMQTALTDVKNDVDKADAAISERFDSVNEFRAQLNDQQRTFMPRLEYEQAHDALISRVDELTIRVNDNTSRAQGASSIWPLVFGVFGMVVGAFGIYMAISNRQRQTK